MDKEQILDILNVIADDINGNFKPEDFKFTYNQQREMINRVFRNNTDIDCGTIMLRLIVIDSLYSTNAMYSYFAIEDMAKKLMEIGNDDATAEYFYSLVNGGNDYKGLFSHKYGIRKNLSEGNLQTSLMSKYAYYLLLQNKGKYPLGFPIYDSLAIKMYPKVCDKLDIQKDNSIKISSANIPIKTYISALDELRKFLFHNSLYNDLYKGLQQFDILDAYLWRMGKIEEGNFSLLLEKDDYINFISNLGLNFNTNMDKNTQEYTTRICKQNEKGINNKDKYKFDFNALVKYNIKDKETKDIVKGLNNNIYILIDHWKTFYNQ